MLPLICYNRTVVSELKEEVRRLILQEHEPTSGKSIFFSGLYAHTHIHSMIELFNLDFFMI